MLTIDEIILRLYKASGYLNAKKKHAQFQLEKDELNQTNDGIYAAIELLNRMREEERL